MLAEYVMHTRTMDNFCKGILRIVGLLTARNFPQQPRLEGAKCVSIAKCVTRTLNTTGGHRTHDTHNYLLRSVSVFTKSIWFYLPSSPVMEQYAHTRYLVSLMYVGSL